MVNLTPTELTLMFLVWMVAAHWWGRTVGAKKAFESHWQFMANSFCQDGETLTAEFVDETSSYTITATDIEGKKRKIV
jgi:hypothetical protein